MKIILKNKKNVISSLILVCIACVIFDVGYCNSVYIYNLISKTSNFNMYNVSICRIIVYFFLILLSLFILLKNDKEKKLIEHKYKLLFIIIITVVILIVAGLIILKKPLWCRGISIISILGILILFNLINITNNTAFNFLIISTTFGILFAIIIQLNHQLDERQHFITATNFSILNFNYKEKPILDESLNKIPYYSRFNEIDQFLSDKYENKIYTNENIEDVSSLPTVYSPILYIGSALGIAIAKALNGTIIDIYFLGRIFNLLYYIILVYLSIRIIPYKKNIIFVIATIPMSLALAATYSIDGICIGLVFLFISFCIKLKEKNEKINIKDLIKLIVLFALMLTAKSMAYIAVGIIVLILPIKNIVHKGKKYMKIIVPILIILLLIFGMIVIYNGKSKIKPEVRIGGNINVQEQIKYIILHPIHDIILAKNHILDTILNFSWLSSLNHEVFFGERAKNLMLIIMIYILYVSFTEKDYEYNLYEKIIFLIAFFMTYAITTIVMYLSCSEVGALHVKGYQARYILPILPLLLLIVSPKTIIVQENKNKNAKICMFSVGIIIVTIFNIIFI